MEKNVKILATAEEITDQMFADIEAGTVDDDGYLVSNIYAFLEDESGNTATIRLVKEEYDPEDLDCSLEVEDGIYFDCNEVQFVGDLEKENVLEHVRDMIQEVIERSDSDQYDLEDM